MMTLNELIKAASDSMFPSNSYGFGKAAPKPAPKRTYDTLLPSGPPGVWRGNPKMPNQQEKNKYGWTNALYTLPNDNDLAGVRDWNALMRQNILERDPNFQFTDENRWMWDARAANARMRQQEKDWSESSGYRGRGFGLFGAMTDQISPIHFEPGGIRFGFGTNLYDDRNQQVVANTKTDTHPVGFNLQKATNRGLDRQTRGDVLQIAHDSVEAAQTSPYFAPEYYDWASGNAKTWSDAKDVQGLREEYGQDLINEGFTPDQRKQMQNDVGHFVTGDLSNTWFGQATNKIQDFNREFWLRGSLLNLVGAGAAKGVGAMSNALGSTAAGQSVKGGVQALSQWVAQPVKSVVGRMAQSPAMQAAQTFTQKIINSPVLKNRVAQVLGAAAKKTTGVAGTVAKVTAPGAAVQVGVRGLEDVGSHSEGLLHDSLLAMGLNNSRMAENREKWIWGPEGYVQRYHGDSIFLKDQNGNYVLGPDGQRVVNDSNDPTTYWNYVTWGNKNGWEGKLDSPEAQKAYVRWYVNNGNSDPTIIGTPMFKSMSLEDRAGAMKDMLRSRIIAKGKVPVLLGQKASGVPDSQILNEALLHDNDGSIHNTVSDTLVYSDPEEFDTLVKELAPTGGSAANDENTEAVYDLVTDSFVERADKNPDATPGMIRTLVDLNKARIAGLKNDIKEKGSNVVKRIKTRILDDVLGNEKIIDSMSFKSLYNLALTLQQLENIPGGMDFLGDKGPELISKVRSNIQRGLLKSAMDDPLHNIPLLSSLYFATKGWNGLADFSKDPTAFWTTAALLLAGGVLTVSSIFDDDEDEEDDDEDKEYKRALNRQPFT